MAKANVESSGNWAKYSTFAVLLAWGLIAVTQASGEERKFLVTPAYAPSSSPTVNRLVVWPILPKSSRLTSIAAGPM